MTGNTNPYLHSQRLYLVDALRGFALMGLFIVHAVEYFELYWYKPDPGVIHDTVFFLFGGKMALTFALLFGVAVFTMLDKYQQRGIDFRMRLLWRFSLLVIIGYVHNLLYAGDILLQLGINGIFLVLICRLPNVIIFSMMLFCFLQVPTVISFILSFSDPDSPNKNPEFWALSWRNFEVFASASFTELVKYNAWMTYEFKWVFNFETGKFWLLTGNILAGYLLGKMYFFNRCMESNYRLGKLTGTLFLLTMTIYLIQVYTTPWVPEGKTRWYYTQLMDGYFNVSMLSFGVLLFIQVYRFTPLQKLQSLLIPCGKMSLTLYIGQSLIGVPIFYGFGLIWYDTTNQESALLFGIIAWGIQMIFAHSWFRHFVYGPFEWCWRSLTLTRTDVPFRKQSRTESPL